MHFLSPMSHPSSPSVKAFTMICFLGPWVIYAPPTATEEVFTARWGSDSAPDFLRPLPITTVIGWIPWKKTLRQRLAQGGFAKIVLLGSCLQKRTNGFVRTGGRLEAAVWSQVKASTYPSGNSEAGIALQNCLQSRTWLCCAMDSSLDF